MSNGKNVNCNICGTEFYVVPSRLKKNKNHHCSTKCAGIYNSSVQGRKVKVGCTICNKDVFYKLSHFKKIANPTCSMECSAKSKSIRNKGSNNPRDLGLNDYERIFWDRAKNCKYRADAKNIEYSIDHIFLRELYEKQQGLCHYTDLPMELKGSLKQLDNVFSVDRIDSSKGYTKDNVVLCLNIINRFKGDAKLEYFKSIFKAIFIKEQND